MLSISSTAFSIQNEPKGLLDIKHRVYFAEELNGFLEEVTGGLTFLGDDYKTLRTLFLNGSCGIVPITINDGCGLVIEANIFLNEVEWRPDLCECTCEPVDAGFLSLIDQNMGIKAFLNVGRSKNDVDISSSVVTQTNLYYYGQNQQGGGGDIAAQNRVGVRLYDAFKMLVAFMTDGALGFESDYFFPDDIGRGYYTLITGNSLRTGDVNSYPFISFEDLYKDCQRLFNLAFDIETVGGQSVMRIEPIEYFKQNSASLTLSNVDEIIQKTDAKSFYQKVVFGSINFEDTNYTYFPKTAFTGFRKEEYHLGGQCNTKNVLNLDTLTLITDTNKIQAALPVLSGGSTDPSNITDEDTYLVVHYADNSVANDLNPLNPSLVYFNFPLTNYQVATRWGNGIPASIYLFLGSGLNGAKAVVLPTYTPPYQPVSFILAGALLQFPIDYFPLGFDPNGNMVQSTDIVGLGGLTPTWNFGQTMFVAPVDGIYSAEVRLILDIDLNGLYALAINKYDTVASGVIPPIQTVGITSNGTNLYYENGVAIWEGSVTFQMSTGERLAIFIGNTGRIFQGSFFQVGSNFTITQTYNPADNNLFLNEVKYPLSTDEWLTFLGNRHGVLTITHANGVVYSRNRSMTREINSGDTEVTAVSTFNQITS